MNPYTAEISEMTDEQVKEANRKLKEQYGPKAKQMIGLTDDEAKKLEPMNRAERRKWMKENRKFKR